MLVYKTFLLITNGEKKRIKRFIVIESKFQQCTNSDAILRFFLFVSCFTPFIYEIAVSPINLMRVIRTKREGILLKTKIHTLLLFIAAFLSIRRAANKKYHHQSPTAPNAISNFQHRCPQFEQKAFRKITKNPSKSTVNFGVLIA